MLRAQRSRKEFAENTFCFDSIKKENKRYYDYSRKMDLDDNKPFIWRKKYEELGIEIDEKKIIEELKKKIEENRVELEKIRERRERREQEILQKKDDSEFLQRQKELEHHHQWEEQEDKFVMRQHRHRSKLRIRDGRAKPIDLFSHYIDIFGSKPNESSSNEPGFLVEEKIDLSDSPMELINPCDWFNGLRQSDLETLLPDIKTYMNADSELNQQYWSDLLEIARNELSKLQAAKELKSDDKLSSAVVMDLMSLFKDKSIRELDEMEDEMTATLRNNDPSIDVSFYEDSICKLRAYRAKLRLSRRHERNLKRQKDRILDVDKKPPTSSMDEADRPLMSETTGLDRANEPDQDCPGELGRSEVCDEVYGEEGHMKVDDGHQDLRDDDEIYTKCVEEYVEGRYTPDKLPNDQVDSGIVLVDHEREYQLLVRQRNQVCSASNLDEARSATMTSEERAFMNIASKGMNSKEESTFSCESAIPRGHVYAWADKYKPRKPRYFNRVHTGFEWNKYNQTHYDIDNPPPKVVQGYKFNIFYPDLIDKSRAPTFSLTPCQDDKDLCVIRFSAGPPYEDVAFRIVNREWNSSHKSGYRCQFINNILQLWFQFKRYRYRR